ncbi:MAG: SAM-dependent methyltransferase [Nitrospirae bacterium]|nr:SAM-dependent methyltransferase [Nitrospirota bacterium]
MSSLEQDIIERIRNEGPITFEAFMQMALYHPGLGYYSSSHTAIGREGDFYTSPHLHPIFGAMIAGQLMEMWMIMGRPSSFHAVEIGAGAGYLCKDILDYLLKTSDDSSLSQDKEDFLSSLKYIIVEPYEHFQERQEKLLDVFLKNPTLHLHKHLPLVFSKVGNKSEEREHIISWVRSLNELNNIVGCIFSNELLDAFPVHLVEMGNELKEVYVTYDSEKFEEKLDNVSTADLARYINDQHIELQPGYRTEINLQIRKWLEDINTSLSRGFLLTIDYGYTAREYYSEDRSKGTLLCYHKHLFNENPYQHIGEQDITAHVNFSSLKKWGEEFGLKTIGYCSQGTFLVAAGID